VSQKKWSILIVDDEDTFAEALKELLSKQASVLVAHDGAEAVDLADENSFDLIITDLNMPEIDGITLIDILRLQFGAIPIIVFTGFPSAITQLRVEKRSIAYFFEKPVKLEKVEAAVNQLLKMSECDA